MKAYIIKTNGSIIPIEPNSKENGFSLEELKSAIGGGWIEIVQTGDRKKLIVLDEEGKLKNLPLNKKATLLYGNENDFIVGDVLVTTPEWIK